MIVQLEGPNRAALEALWREALVLGGFPVLDGRVLRLDPKQDNNPESKFQFDSQHRLISANTSGPKLLASAPDAAGQQVAPGWYLHRLESGTDLAVGGMLLLE